jgi:zinc protease
MFNGARKYGPQRFDQLLEAAGGRNNAYTSRNITAYQDWFPSESLELVMDLEADRMAHLTLDAEMFESERGVVASERRMSTENDNLGILEEQLWAMAYTAHPYHWPIIGWMTDILNWKLDELREYFRTFYAPNNALLVVVGDVLYERVMELAEIYFQPISSQPLPRPVTTQEPQQMGERRAQVKKPAQLPAFIVGYHVPPSSHADFAAVQVLRTLLLHGQSSRLYRRLVSQDQLATSVGGGSELSFDPTLFHITVQMKSNCRTSDAETAIFEELTRLATEPAGEVDLNKARNMLLAGFYRGLKTIGGKANLLGNFELFFGDYRRLFEIADCYAAVTADDLQRVAQLYFGDRNRTIATLVPENQLSSSASLETHS